jgi:hypothetical protein
VCTLHVYTAESGEKDTLEREVKRDKPCTSTLLTVEKATTCTMHIHTAGVGKRYVQTLLLMVWLLFFVRV